MKKKGRTIKKKENKEQTKNGQLHNQQKRDFLKKTAGFALLPALGASSKAAMADYLSIEQLKTDKFDLQAKKGYEIYYPGGLSLKELKAKKMDQQPNLLRQMEVITKAASSRKNRANFMIDPYGFASNRGVELDQDFVDYVLQQITEGEEIAAGLGYVNQEMVDSGTLSLQSVTLKPGADAHTMGLVQAMNLGMTAAAVYFSARATDYC